MTKYIVSLFFTTFIISIVPHTIFSADKKAASSPVVLEIGKDKKITLQKFEDFYRRYGGKPTNASLTKDEADKFFDLFVKYELKLVDALSRGFDTTQDVQTEIREYRNDLATSYLLEQEVTLPQVKKMYERRKEEIRARHILFKFPEVEEEEEEEMSEEDSLQTEKPQVDTNAIKQKAQDAIRRLQAGEKFDALAQELTEDPSGKNNGGDLYYFTTGQMVSQFEDACYAMNIGDITTEPVQTIFGFHVIQVTDRKPAVGSMRASHIMARFNSSNPSPEDTMHAWKKINALMDSVKAKGADFSLLAKRNSDDAGSAANGGDVDTFPRRRWVQSFDEAAYNLKKGELSNIVRTPYGYHIIKCTEIHPVGTFEAMKEELKSQYLSSRFQDDKAAFLASLRKKYTFTEHASVLQQMLQSFDTSKVIGDSAWADAVPSAMRKQTICSYAGKNLSVDSLLKLVEAMPENYGMSLLPSDIRAVLERMYEHFLLLEEASDVETRFPVFSQMLDEFRDGIILYRAEQQEVWSNISVTDSALDAYFENNREKFRFPHRVNLSAIYVGNDTLANKTYQRLLKGETFDTVALTENASILMRLRKGLLDWLPADQDTMTRLAWKMEKGTYNKPFLVEGKGYTVFYVNDKDSSRLKTFDEAGSEVSNVYQDSEAKRLENEWIERVKKKISVKMYRDVVRKSVAKKK